MLNLADLRILIVDDDQFMREMIKQILHSFGVEEIEMADTVVIFGQGSMGLECLQIARLSGAGMVITVDVREESCAISQELGADHPVMAECPESQYLKSLLCRVFPAT